MRGKLAKKLRRAAKEMSGSGWKDRGLAELTGTKRRKFIKAARFLLAPFYYANGRMQLRQESMGAETRDVEIETFTAINHPTTTRSRYRLLKRAYMRAKHDHN